MLCRTHSTWFFVPYMTQKCNYFVWPSTHKLCKDYSIFKTLTVPLTTFVERRSTSVGRFFLFDLDDINQLEQHNDDFRAQENEEQLLAVYYVEYHSTSYLPRDHFATILRPFRDHYGRHPYVQIQIVLIFKPSEPAERRSLSREDCVSPTEEREHPSTSYSQVFGVHVRG